MTIPADTELIEEKQLQELARLEDDAARKEFFDSHPGLLRAEVVTRLAEIVVRRVRVNALESLRLAGAAIGIARLLENEESLAVALRAQANAFYASGEYHRAAEHHRQAAEIFERLQKWNEAARTLSSSIQPLLLLGEYDRAFAAAERARDTFTRLNLPWRLARLEINVGNIFHRQDRLEEALAHYENAYQGLLDHQDAEGMAVVLSNMAVCLISLNDFPRALATYQQARRVSEQNGMPLLAAQADYNIAYLYYLRGEYSRAMEMLYAARRRCQASGDAYHHALCYLDLSEIYLELNLSEEAREMAHEGFQRFEKLAMPYEMAKTLANEAIAFGQQGKAVAALERFARAREIFVRESNRVWPWLIDLYQALLLFREGRYFEARRLCSAAANFFDQSVLTGKAVLAHLLLGRIALQMGSLDAAQAEAESALARLGSQQAAMLFHQTYSLLGQIAQARGDFEVAYSAYLRARKALEALRSRLQGEELKISFAKNRLQVYEALVELCLAAGREGSAAEAFGYMEATKSRSMVELAFPSAQLPTAPSDQPGQSVLVSRIRDLREELNWYYHRIELEQLRPEERTRQRIEQLEKEAQARENELLRTLRELPAEAHEDAELVASADVSLEKIQASLPEGSALIEYYSAGEQVFAAVVTPSNLRIVPVTVVSRVTGLLHLLRFQLSKFRLGGEYVRKFSEPLLRATHSHLEALFAELVAPLDRLLDARRLIIVPHGPLHHLPFHALRSADGYLGDAFTISYAPSATIFALCQARAVAAKPTSLVLGIPDERAPQILAEIESIAGILPQPELYIGARATSSLLREKGPECGLLHIATHGVYRQDNPMFSAIRMGDNYLNLYDLYQLRLDARLVTLSGCATGMNVVAAGDELLGLERGLLRAGAASLLLSLWDVHDRTTAALMKSFYTGLIRTGDAASSLQSAMREIRNEHPHPYFWAPFFLVGKLTDSQKLS